MAHINGQTGNSEKDFDLIPSTFWGKVVPDDESRIRENLLELEQKIAPCKPRIIGITKYYGLDAIINGYKAGLRDFGESRVVESSKKIQALPDEIKKNSTFHFIGHLQTNKAEKAVKYFDYIHSIDSLKIASAVSRAAVKLNKSINILLQINNACEEQKSGYSLEELKKDMPFLLSLENLNLVGLMNMAPIGADEKFLHEIFGGLRNLRDELEVEFNIKLPELSMGMSDDYIIAVQENATMIRIGRKLFNNK